MAVLFKSSGERYRGITLLRKYIMSPIIIDRLPELVAKPAPTFFGERLDQFMIPLSAHPFIHITWGKLQVLQLTTTLSSFLETVNKSNLTHLYDAHGCGHSRWLGWNTRARKHSKTRRGAPRGYCEDGWSLNCLSWMWEGRNSNLPWRPRSPIDDPNFD